MKAERLNCCFARLTKGPAASPNPITRKARKTGAAWYIEGLYMGLVETWTRDVFGTMTSFRFGYRCTARRSRWVQGDRAIPAIRSAPRGNLRLGGWAISPVIVQKDFCAAV